MRISFLILVFFLMGCRESRLYEDFINLEGTWHQDSTLVFSFEIEDSLSSYDIDYTVANRNTYPFQNLYIKYELLDEEDSVIDENLQEMILFDPKTGSPNGSGSGNLFSNTQNLSTGFRFPGAENYRVVLTQFMRQESLSDIERVGVRVSFHLTE